eukprot:c13358_g1_i2 orf=3-209(-)
MCGFRASRYVHLKFRNHSHKLVDHPQVSMMHGLRVYEESLFKFNLVTTSYFSNELGYIPLCYQVLDLEH